VSDDQGSFGRGVLAGLALTVGGMVVVLPIMGGALSMVHGTFGGWVLLMGIGIVQLLWMLPAWLIYRRRGQAETSKGILIIAVLVFLLNASCWGLMFSNKIKIGG
jgi:hypothetical protein